MQPAGVAASAFRQIVLPPNTDVIVTPNDLLTSKSLKVGETFVLSTVLDVMQDGFIVIPRGTVGQGTVTYRTGKGAFGKSATIPSGQQLHVHTAEAVSFNASASAAPVPTAAITPATPAPATTGSAH